LSDYTYIKYFPTPFLDDLVQGRCLPFIGAGFSLNAKIPVGEKMPDWDGLGRKAAENILGYQYTTAIEALSAYAHEFSRVKLVEFLSSALLVTSIQPAKTHEYFCKLPFERVITTNFDFLLEQTYTSINKYCIPLIFEEQLAVGSLQAGSVVRLLKIHGDLHHPNRLVATEEDYDSFLSLYPLLATYLSSFLIDHTALFIGYSLDDPDFRQIWQMVKERLGELRRPAYVLQVDAPPHVLTRYERRGVKVINLPKSTSQSYSQILDMVFQELRNYWLSKTLTLSTTTEDDSQAELSLSATAQAQGRLAFFSVPMSHAAFYKSRIYPIAERYGFSPIMAVDVLAPGDSIMAKIDALITTAAVVITDLGSQNAAFEIGTLFSKGQSTKHLIIITEDSTSIPFDMSSESVLIAIRPPLFEGDMGTFLNALETHFEKISQSILFLEDEPNRLIKKREYKAAVIAAFILLEHELRKLLLVKQSPYSRETKYAMSQLVEYTFRNELIDDIQRAQIHSYTNIRNKLVHTAESIESNEAKKIVDRVLDLVKSIRKKNNIAGEL